MQKVLGLCLTIAFAGSLITSCDESSSTIGSELVNDEVSIVVDSTFTLSGHSIETDAVLSRTVMQLIGIVDAPEYGLIKSDVVTQFMPANSMDTTGVTLNTIDSLKLVMLVSPGSFVGDSLALLGLEVYPLVQQLQTPIYSDFDPAGYYDANNKLGSLVYNLTKMSEPDSLQNLTYHTLSVNLPLELGRKFYSEYIENPTTYASPLNFAKFFPGLYIKNSYGSGRITRIGNTTMQLYYHQNTVNDAGRDTTYYKVGNYFAVTPEIITNNDISLSMAPEIYQRVDQGETILLAPAGMEVEIQFPATDIMRAYKDGTKNAIGVVNSLSLNIPVETITNKYNITPPEDVLLVLKKDKKDFFLQNKLADNTTSFMASLTTLSDGSQAYVISDMRQYIVDLLSRDNVTADDYTFDLVPVTVTKETNTDFYGNTTTTVTGVIPYVTEPKMARILLDQTKIHFVYSRQTTNF